MKTLLKTRHFSSFQIIILGFLAVIFLGSLLLMLPVSTRQAGGASFQDALFTATSSVCVTGLVVRDTATYWSGFGQAVILLLIQIGGMGVITVAVLFSIASGRKIGLMQRQTMQEAISAPQVGGIVRLTGFILRAVAVIEGVGFLALLPVYAEEFGIGRGCWYALFHSVSAFCNAGFDLMGAKEPFSSLTAYHSNAIVNFTIMALIVVGGIGFLTWDDIRRNKYHFRKYRMQSKVILCTTAILIALPAVYFFFCEYGGEGLKDRIWLSLFQSVTTRTAGFNTADLAGMHDSGKLLMVLLMLIGGSPGSTAGGMKTTTAAVLAATAIAVFKRQESAHFFGRRIPTESIRNAAAILLMYLTLFLSGAAVISYVERLPLLTTLFETASAIGTVGLTLGITTQLCALSRLILILLMFFGRVGGLTLIFAAVSETQKGALHFPKEKITVG